MGDTTPTGNRVLNFIPCYFERHLILVRCYMLQIDVYNRVYLIVKKKFIHSSSIIISNSTNSVIMLS
jgi:hypothetical protein